MNRNEHLAALSQLLSSNSDRFSEEEVKGLNEVIIWLSHEEPVVIPRKEVREKSKSMQKKEYVEITLTLLKIFADPEILKIIHDVFTH